MKLTEESASVDKKERSEGQCFRFSLSSPNVTMEEVPSEGHKGSET